MDLECIGLAIATGGATFALGQLVVAICPWIRLRRCRCESRQRGEANTRRIRRRFWIVAAVEIDLDDLEVRPAKRGSPSCDGVSVCTSSVLRGVRGLEHHSLPSADGGDDLCATLDVTGNSLHAQSQTANDCSEKEHHDV